MSKLLAIGIFLLCLTARAQLTVTVSPPKTAGQKIVVALNMTNELTNEIKSARAICLLLDEHGKMVGQSTKWVIGQKRIGLYPKENGKFDFVITPPQPLMSSNLTAKIIFSWMTMADGQVADVRQTVEVVPANAAGNTKSH